MRVKVINTHRERKYTPSRQREGDLNKSISQQTHIEKERKKIYANTPHTAHTARREGLWRRFHTF